MFIQELFWNLTYSLPKAFYITINPKGRHSSQRNRTEGAGYQRRYCPGAAGGSEGKERGKQGAWRSIVTRTSLEQQWAYYTKYIYSMWHLPTGQLYLALKAVLAGKD